MSSETLKELNEPPVGPKDVDGDPLVVAVRSGADVRELLVVVRNELVIAAAELDFWAVYASPLALEQSRHVSRRVRVLRKFADVVLAEHRSFGSTLGPDSAIGKTVLGLLVVRIAGVAREVLPESTAETFISLFNAALEADPAIPWP